MNFQEYIKPELLILIPVLYIIAEGIKKTEIPCRHIPWILGVVGVFLSFGYVVTVSPLDTLQTVASALFSAVTQGVLVAGASVYANQLIKQANKEEN